MKKLILKGALIFGGVLSIFTANAQFTMSGEIRPRTEYRHGYKSLADSAQKAAFFTDQRTRLNLGYKSKGYQMKIVLQDIRVWGNQSQLVGNQDFGASIHEAWGEAFLSDKLSMKFGRQEIVYDDHRIFGNVGWAQQARSHDALLFIYKVDSTFNIHLGGAFNQDKAQLTTTLYTVPKSYKAMQYLWLHKDFSKNLGASVLLLNNGKQASTISGGQVIFKDNYSQTVGTRITYKRGKTGASLSYYSQMGKDIDASDYYNNPKIRAMLFGADVSYKITAGLSSTLGFEYQSGQSQTQTASTYTSVKHAFTPFYGTNHKFNGYMDYFYVGSGHGGVGLQDIYVKLKYNADNNIWVGLDWHKFSAASDVLDVNELANTGQYTAMDGNLGMEIDLTAGWKIAEGVDFKVGYSQMFGTSTLGILKGVTTTNAAGDIIGRTDQTSNWAWMMVTIKPNFIK